MKKSEEKLPAKEYRGKLQDAADFGNNIFAITIAQPGQTAEHIGPFQFERPILLYKGQEVAVWISGERTEKGIFHARMRWTNPVPIGRKGGAGKKSKSSPSPRPKKGETRKRRKAMLRDMLAADATTSHLLKDVCFALNLEAVSVATYLNCPAEDAPSSLTTTQVDQLKAYLEEKRRKIPAKG